MREDGRTTPLKGGSVPGELVARLEAASVGSLDLDSEILAHLGFTWHGLAGQHTHWMPLPAAPEGV